MTPSRGDFVYAPVLFGAYGVIRTLDGLDGTRGPGFAWTAGHLCFVAGLAFFIRGFVTMRERAGRDRWSTAGLWTACAGAFAFAVQFGADLVTGFLAADHEAMSELVSSFQDAPGVTLAFYAVGPALFFIGQLLLVGRLAALRILRWWAPALVLTCSLLPNANKDLIPLGAALLLVAYTPLYLGKGGGAGSGGYPASEERTARTSA
ncbi:hypothetical protein [Streptomyces antnestii]|uniref:hypothetical protein n=1 Tax=Streptomyces antnestii TaxID=2494256 RepID=UPI00167309D5|nr:hypothetical protein [Streptomyces sp. San01]